MTHYEYQFERMTYHTHVSSTGVMWSIYMDINIAHVFIPLVWIGSRVTQSFIGYVTQQLIIKKAREGIHKNSHALQSCARIFWRRMSQ